MDEVNDMMRTWKANSSASRHEVACDWLKNNEKRWRSWIPDPTVCNRGPAKGPDTMREMTSLFCCSRGFCIATDFLKSKD